jgi:hypothetical protein
MRTAGCLAAGVVLIASGVCNAQPGCTPWWQQSFGFPANTNGPVYALAGLGSDVYVGGEFDVIEVRALAGSPSTWVTTFASGVARYDGSAWHPMGTGVNAAVKALLVYDDGTGPALFAGGQFSMAGGVLASRVAKYDPTADRWFALGAGVNGPVYAMAVYNDGTGPALFVGGGFFTAGGVYASQIAKWNGTAWSPLGTAVNNGVNAPVNTMAVYNDGTGSALFVGGAFTLAAGGAPATYIARWNGVSWFAPLNGNIPAPGLGAMTTFNDGSGDVLYISKNTIPVITNLLSWNGSQWNSYSPPPNVPASNSIALTAFAEFNDGRGRALWCAFGAFFGGQFTMAGFNGQSWLLPIVAPPYPTSAYFGSLLAFDNGTGPALYCAGRNASPGPPFELAKLNGCPPPPPCYPDCNGDGVLGLADFGCFQTKFALNDPYADCNGDGVLGLADFGCFQTKFALGCP